MDVKQVIVLRKDLNMRKGKMIAQGAHASSFFILEKMKQLLERPSEVSFTQAELFWVNTNFKKIVCSVNSEKELDDVYDIAKQQGLFVRKVIDSGKTEFHDIETITAICIGPDLSSKIDIVTGHLDLL